jgi:hypothetical protein
MFQEQIQFARPADVRRDARCREPMALENLSDLSDSL